MRFFKYILALSIFAASSFANTNVNTKTLQETLDNIDNWLGALSVVQGNSNAVTVLNENFNLLSNDLSVLDVYLLGGTVSNQYTNVTWSSVGSDTNSALIPALQYNQDITTDNFSLVNSNTVLTTNLFLTIVSDFLELGQYAVLSTNPTPQEEEFHRVYTNFTARIDSFSTMNTSYSALPFDLSFSFPSLLAPLTFGLDTIIEEVQQPEIRVFSEINYYNSVIGVSHTNGLDQFVVITNHNSSIVFSTPPLGVPDTLNFWVKNSGFTNISFSGAVQVNTNAFNISGQTAILYNRYHSSPFSSENLWYEDNVFPYGSVAITQAPPAQQIVSVTTSNLVNCTLEITTGVVAGANSRIFTFYPTTSNANATAVFNTDTSATFRVLVVGGGGGGGSPFGGGGGGGVANLNPSVALSAGSYNIVVGTGGIGGSSADDTKLKSDGTAGSTSSFHTVTAAGGSGGVGWTRWSGPGGSGGNSGSAAGGVPSAGTTAGGGGAASGSVAGGNGAVISGLQHGGTGASGVILSPRGYEERFGAGGGGGQYAGSRVQNFGGIGGGGNGGINTVSGQPGSDGTGWGAAGGGATVLKAGNGYRGIVVISHPL